MILYYTVYIFGWRYFTLGLKVRYERLVGLQRGNIVRLKAGGGMTVETIVGCE